MVRLPAINTGERTLCQDKGSNSSSFWQSVAQRDQSDVYRHPEYKNLRATVPEDAEDKTWTYDYSPRSKANYWDWHHERPVRKQNRPVDPELSKSPDVALAVKRTASTRDDDVDYVRDYLKANEYDQYNRHGDGSLRADRSDNVLDHLNAKQYDDYNKRTASFRGHGSDKIPDHLKTSEYDQYNRRSDGIRGDRSDTDRLVQTTAPREQYRDSGANNDITKHQDDDYQAYLHAVNRERERHRMDHHDHDDARERHDERYKRDVRGSPANDHDVRSDRDDRYKERYDRGGHSDVRDKRDQYDVDNHHGNKGSYDTRDYHYTTGHSDVRDHQDYREHYNGNHGNRNHSDKSNDHNNYSDIRNEHGYPERRHYNQNGVSGSDNGSIDRNSYNENTQQTGDQHNVKQQYKHPNSRRYESETMSKFRYQESPRINHKPPSREPALGIVPGNEYYEPEPFERMLPNHDREQTFKLPTYPFFSYGRKKKVEDRNDNEHVQLVDPEPQDYLLNEKLISRKKFLAGPADSLSVPGFDGGAKPPGTISPRRIEQITSHPSNKTEIDIA